MKFFVWFLFYALKLDWFVDLNPLDIDITGFIHMPFIISFSYGGRKFHSMEDLQYHQFMKVVVTSKTTIKPQSLAPTESATKFHSMRVHTQVIKWKTLMNVKLNPLDWRWKLSNGHYCPIMMDLNRALDNILRFI